MLEEKMEEIEKLQANNALPSEISKKCCRNVAHAHSLIAKIYTKQHKTKQNNKNT